MQTSLPHNEEKSLYTIGGIAALLQLVTILTYSVVTTILGPKPATAEEYFAIHQFSPLTSLLRGDLFLLVLVVLYIGTFPALYVALRRLSPIYSALAVIFTFMTVVGAFSSESTLSLFYLGKQYVTAMPEQRDQLIAAATAIMASDFWNGTAAYLGGILLQGSGVMMSIIMLRSKDFHKLTAWSGLLGNGFDLVQHLIHLFLPAIAAPIQLVMGIFYLVWYPLLARDLFRLRRRISVEDVR